MSRNSVRRVHDVGSYLRAYHWHRTIRDDDGRIIDRLAPDCAMCGGSTEDVRGPRMLIVFDEVMLPTPCSVPVCNTCRADGVVNDRGTVDPRRGALLLRLYVDRRLFELGVTDV